MRVAVIGLLTACRTVVGPEVAPSEDPTQAWGAVLAEVVGDDGLVDYDRVDRDVLDAYIGWTSEGRVPRAKEQEAAFWLNARAARVMWLALEARAHGTLLDDRGKAFTFGAERLSIDEIEDERLRLPLQDVRLHGGLWSATRTGPPLRDELWVGRLLDAQLDDQMTRWVDDPVRGVRIVDGAAVLDATFAAYPRDFHDWTAGDDPCTTAARFSARRAELVALAREGCPHGFAPADLALDDAPR